jgi:hypothetical protein
MESYATLKMNAVIYLSGLFCLISSRVYQPDSDCNGHLAHFFIWTRWVRLWQPAEDYNGHLAHFKLKYSVLNDHYNLQRAATLDYSVVYHWYFGMDPDPLTNWSGSGSRFCYFRPWPTIRQQKTIFSAYFFLKVHLHNFSNKKSQNSRNQGFFSLFCLMIEVSGSVPLTNGSRSGSRRPTNMDPDPQHCLTTSFSIIACRRQESPRGSKGTCCPDF